MTAAPDDNRCEELARTFDKVPDLVLAGHSLVFASKDSASSAVEVAAALRELVKVRAELAEAKALAVTDEEVQERIRFYLRFAYDAKYSQTDQQRDAEIGRNIDCIVSGELI